MIDEIVLRNVALIREASMVPSPRLTVLTGESGSGKTAFLSGLKLLVGERGSAEMVRDGASLLDVEGRFICPGEAEEQEIVVSRGVASDGRSRVRLNGSLATVGELAQTVGVTVDLCGQHEHQQLLHPANQAKMLDDWIGEALEAPLALYRQRLQAAAEAKARIDELRALGSADSARVEEARYLMRRVDEVNPQPDEYDELLEEARRMENVEGLVRSAGGAREALSGEGGAIEGANKALALLRDAASLDGRYKNQAQAVLDACVILEDAAREVDALMPDADTFDAARLEEVQARLLAFQGLMRAYGPTMTEVQERYEEASLTVAAVDDLDGQLAEARRAHAKAEADLVSAADKLAFVRRSHAPRFVKAVNDVIARLDMPGCGISCAVERLDREKWGPQGPDQVSFAFRPGRAADPRPLNRIASGGELSRVTLAIKTVMGEADRVETLVFDEVDAGVGGKAAIAVGEVLRELARTHQVIVVTHLPQIAVLGDVHYVVERVGERVPETRMKSVNGAERIDEVARMLSGTVDETSRAHASELLKGAL